MSVVSFSMSASGTPVYIDGAGAEGKSDATTPVALVTHSYPPSVGADNIWNVKVLWNANTKAATAQITDAAPGNTTGPTVMTVVAMSDVNTPALFGRDPSSATWYICAQGGIADLSSLPVALTLQAWGAGLRLCATDPATDGGATNCTGPATVWTLQPFGDSVPPAAYTGLVITDTTLTPHVNVSVQVMLVEIWNRCVGTDWATTYAPTLIAWMYDYPKWWPAQAGATNGVNPKWITDVTNKLYNAVYKPYFVQNQSGFGSGDPPDGDPPTLKTR
jgi:hypothetical protein